jgi:hypothetical protein
VRARVGGIRDARRNNALRGVQNLFEFALGFVAIDRYERPGFSRRKFGKRRFEALGAERSAGQANLSDSRRAVLALLEAAAPDLMAAEIQRVRQGDPAARRFCLELTVKTRDRPVSFPMSKTPTFDVAEMTGFALAAVAGGKLTPREGREIVAFICDHLRATEAMDWERRVREVEERSPIPEVEAERRRRAGD